MPCTFGAQLSRSMLHLVVQQQSRWPTAISTHARES